VIRSFLQRAAPEPEYQGVNTRLSVRLVIGLVFLPPTILVELKHGSVAQQIYILVYPLIFCGFFEWWGVRRSGLTFSSEQLTLKFGPFYRFIAWPRIHGVEWRPVGAFESLCIRLDGDKRLGAPIVWRLRSTRFKRLGSTNLRTPAGQQVDAVATIELALKNATSARTTAGHKGAQRGH
jgi:hypothetical protein